MDYISDINFIDDKNGKLVITDLNSAKVTMAIGGNSVVFLIADFIDMLKLLSEITERT